MPIPSLNNDGFLPAGIHDATMEELGKAFGQFQGSQRRVSLYGKLQQYVAELRFWGNAKAILVDGSFVSAAAAPNDIDLIVLCRPGFDLSAEMAPSEYNVMDSRRVRRLYGFDAIPVGADSDQAVKWATFFSRDSRTGRAAKGLVRITL